MQQTVTVIFNNSDYLIAHGKEPRGYGVWAFAVEDEKEPIFTRFSCPLTAAKAEIRKRIREEGRYQGIVFVEVCP